MGSMRNDSSKSQGTPPAPSAGPLDHLDPEEQVRAIDLAMQHYFESKDWVRTRNKEFPGSGKHYWLQAPNN